MDPSAYRLHAEVEQRHWWFVARRRILDAVLRSLPLPSGAHLLEFGSGTGGNLPLLGGFGRVWAIEPSQEARTLGAELAPEVTQAPSLESLPASLRFHAAFLFDVLEHLDDPVATLRALHARLHPGGSLVVTVPAHPFLFGEHDRYLHHRRRYTARALRADLTGGGFTVEQLSPMNAALFPAALAGRAAEWLRTLVTGPRTQPRGMSVPPPPVNRALAEIFAAERFVLPAHRLPFGLSLLATARR